MVSAVGDSDLSSCDVGGVGHQRFFLRGGGYGGERVAEASQPVRRRDTDGYRFEPLLRSRR